LLRDKETELLTPEEQLARGPMDLPFLLLTMLLLGIGLVMVLSASSASSYYESGNATHYFLRQALFAGPGVVVMFLISKINYQTFRGLSVLLLVISFVGLVLVLVPGIGETRNHATRWINFMGLFTIQPSEIMKVAVILYFSARISKMREKAATIRGMLPFVTILAAIAVLLYLEPHMSATILIFLVGAALLFVGGAKLHWFVGGGLIAATGLYFVITKTEYMQARIDIWKDPWLDPLGRGFQTIQSLYAIGSGGLLGLGLGRSRQKYLYLPEEHNDFVFAIVCEELGFIGGSIVLLLFALLILRGYWLAIHARDRFGSLVIVGITTQLAVQVFLNIGVVTNLFPVTGISLPFFSYGGTALLIQLAEMGMVLSVSRQIPAPKSG